MYSVIFIPPVKSSYKGGKNIQSDIYFYPPTILFNGGVLPGVKLTLYVLLGEGG